jgi:hypothetical protein
VKNLTILENRPRGTKTSVVGIRLPIDVIERVVDYGRRNMCQLGLAYERLLNVALAADEQALSESEVSNNAEET